LTPPPKDEKRNPTSGHSLPRPTSIGMAGRLQSEQVADISPECPADIIGICRRAPAHPAADRRTGVCRWHRRRSPRRREWPRRGRAGPPARRRARQSAHRMAVARDKTAAPLLDIAHGPKAVVLDVEQPAGAVERLLSPGRDDRLYPRQRHAGGQHAAPVATKSICFEPQLPQTSRLCQSGTRRGPGPSRAGAGCPEGPQRQKRPCADTDPHPSLGQGAGVKGLPPRLVSLLRLSPARRGLTPDWRWLRFLSTLPFRVAWLLLRRTRPRPSGFIGRFGFG